MIQILKRFELKELAAIMFFFLSIFFIGSCTTSKQSQTNISEVKDYRIHRIKRGETIRSIASRYRVTQEEVKNLNPGLKIDLKEGQTIKVPAVASIEKKVIVKEKPLEPKPEVEKKETYHLGLILPFALSANAEVEDISNASKTALEFYQGALLACDSLTSQGLNFKLHVYDSENDSLKIKQIFNYSEINQMSLMVSPIYSGNARQVSNLAKEKKINLLAPFSNNIDFVANNPYFIASSPSVSTQCAKMADYLFENYNKANFIIIHNNKSKEKELSEIFRKNLTSKSKSNVKIINYSAAGLKNITDNIINAVDNIIIIPSSDQAFVVQILTLLKNSQINGKITVIGLPTWEKFDIIDPETLEFFKVLIFNEDYVDYKSDIINKFRNKYINKYNMEPSNNAYVGFDVFYFFGSSILKYGKKFPAEVPDFKMMGLHTQFDFTKTEGSVSGLENSHVFILQFKNFQLLKIN